MKQISWKVKKMHFQKKITKVLLLVLLGIPHMVHAQDNQDLLLFDNSSQDFLLPSYLDTNQPTPEVPTDIDILTEIFGNQATQQVTQPKPQTKTIHPSKQKEQKKELLTPLDPLPTIPEKPLQLNKPNIYTSQYAVKLLNKEEGKNKINIAIPTDLRLTFTPNSTQLTESALNWISAYALHIQKDPRLEAVIRISNKNWPLQQARLSLIVKKMMEKGLPTQQIRILQSNRDENTLIIGKQTNQNQTPIITPQETKKIIKKQKTLLW